MRKVPSIKELWDMQPERDRYSPYKRVGKSISIYLTKLLLYTPISPNQVTLLHGVLYIGAACLLVTGQPVIVLLSALVIRGSGVLDQVDGQLAYARNTASPEGYLLDTLVGFLERISLFVFVFLGVYIRYPSWLTVVFGITATLAYIGKELLALIPDQILYRMVLREQPWAAMDSFGRRPETGRSVASTVGIYDPERRLPRILGALTHHFNVVNLLIVGAAIDLCLYWAVPNIAPSFSGLYAFLVLCAVLGSVDTVGRVAYIIHTGHIRQTFSEFPEGRV